MYLFFGIGRPGNSNSRSSSLDFDVDEIDFDLEMQKLEQELALESDESDNDLQTVLSSELGVTINSDEPKSAEATAPPSQIKPLEQGSEENEVVEADGQELIERAISTQPDIIILNSLLTNKQSIIKSLRFEKGLEHVLFLVYQ